MRETPHIKALNDEDWILTEAFTIRGYEVPEGFITDLASIPKPLWWVFGHPTSYKYQRAAVLHDYLSREAVAPKCIAHTLFLHMLLEDGVRPWKAWAMYYAVRIFG